MRAWFFLLLLASLGSAAIDGAVTNATTGQPQSGATVTLYTVGGAGPEAVESVKSGPNGQFSMNQTPQGPAMLQTAYDGVVYTKMLPPGQPTSAVALTVYESQPKPGQAELAQHIILLEAGDDITIHETFFFDNTGNQTYYDPDRGTLKFHTPQGVTGRIEVTAKAPDGLPIPRAANPAGEPNAYSVDFPIKPGESRFDITYQLPYNPPQTFSNRFEFPPGKTRLVVPAGVSIEGPEITFAGQEPQTQAFIYDVTAPQYTVQVEGTGSLRGAGAPAGGGPSIQPILPRIYDRMYIVLGLAGLILLIGFLLMYRRPAPDATVESRRTSRR